MTTTLNVIGNTPLVRLERLFSGREIYLKLEGQNPGGSVKDRVAKFLVEQALKSGELVEGMSILEATSGNMGIALAMVGAAMGIPVRIVMSEGMSQERRHMIQAFGAELDLTESRKGTAGAREKMLELVEQNPGKYWMVNQFDNENNVRAHELSLAPEIYSQLKNVGMVVSGIGTSGTAVGLARFFQKKNLNVSLVAVRPPAGFKIQGIQHPEGDFLPGIWEEQIVSDIVDVSQKESFEMVRRIAREEGLLVGQSTGAVLAAIDKITESRPIVLISADRGEKYLSTGIFNVYKFEK